MLVTFNNNTVINVVDRHHKYRTKANWNFSTSETWILKQVNIGSFNRKKQHSSKPDFAKLSLEKTGSWKLQLTIVVHLVKCEVVQQIPTVNENKFENLY